MFLYKISLRAAIFPFDRRVIPVLVTGICYSFVSSVLVTAICYSLCHRYLSLRSVTLCVIGTRHCDLLLSVSSMLVTAICYSLCRRCLSRRSVTRLCHLCSSLRSVTLCVIGTRHCDLLLSVSSVLVTAICYSFVSSVLVTAICYSLVIGACHRVCYSFVSSVLVTAICYSLVIGTCHGDLLLVGRRCLSPAL
jgi:hypothetical protein